MQEQFVFGESTMALYAKLFSELYAPNQLDLVHWPIPKMLSFLKEVLDNPHLQ